MNNIEYTNHAETVLLYMKNAKENGLLAEWLATFLEHYGTGRYSISESCYHADYEWDL